MYTRKIGLGLAGGALVMYLGHGYGHAIDVSCPREVRLLPACGAGDEGPSAPPLASVMIASTTSSTSTVATGGSFVVFDAVTDEERSVPAKHPLSITLR
jgi:hypothetical protein